MADSTSVSTPAQGGSAVGAARAPRVGSTRDFKVRARDGRTLEIRATADWLLLRKNEKPLADMFYVHYSVSGASSPRPLTFVFNGGPGAASAYLHVGALGPKRVRFAADGTVLPPPAELVDNDTTWLSFTDLVFVDPIGTGFSRTYDEEPAKGTDGKSADAKGDASKAGAA